MTKIRQTLAYLDDNNIQYKYIEHKAAYTIPEMEELGLYAHGHICKNLFLRDAKGRRHFLVLIRADKHADLKSLGEAIGSRLSFASEERLEKYLNLTKGSVTPLGVIYDEGCKVEVIVDSNLQNEPIVGVHPCENTATVFMPFESLLRLLSKNHKISVVDI